MVKRKTELTELILSWSEKNLRDFPWRKNRTPYRILLAEFLLKRTTAAAAEAVFGEFVKRYPDLLQLSKANRDELKSLLSKIGLQRQRTKAVLKASSFIFDEFRGDIPSEREKLLEIPHIGPYTAGAILSLGWKERAVMLDSNVKRVLSRVHSNNKDLGNHLEDLANFYVPSARHARYNLGVIDLGGLICRYDKPRCDRCPLREICDYPVSAYN